MNIVFVLDEQWDSALTHYACGIYEAISKNHNTTIFCLENSYIDKKYTDDKIHIKKLRNKNPIKSLTAFKYFAKKLNAVKPDMVITILGDATFFSCLLKKPLNFKLMRIFGENKRLKTPRECIDHLILPADFLKDNVDAKKVQNISVVKGFFDDRRFRYSKNGREIIRKSLNIDDKEIVFGSVGRLDPIKGYPMLIKAFSELPQNTRLIIVGEEKNEPLSNLERIIDNQGLNNRVIIINERLSNISDIMSAFDIGVISSVGSETIARVMFEFMAIGLPVVATDIGMLKEISDDSFSILAQPNQRSLSDALKTILKNDLNEMGKNALKSSQQYTKHAFTQHITSIIN